MQNKNKKVSQPVPAPESDLTSIWRGLLAAAEGAEQPRNTMPNVDDVLGISEKNDNGHDPGSKRGEDSYQSTYEAGLASGREADYRQGYREGFLDGYKLRNPVRGPAATLDKSAVGSNKTTAKSVIRLRGLPCANCGQSSYTDELDCPGCGTPKARTVGEKIAKVNWLPEPP